MIQPEAYYAAHKKCHSPEELGRLGFIIVGRGDELSPAPSSIELSFAETLMECNQWHNEKREEVKEKWRKDKARQRKDKEMSTNVHQCPQDNEGQAMSTTSIYLPTYLPTDLPNKTNTIRTVPDKGVKGESASVRLNVFSMPGEEFFSGKHSTLELCKAALGDGFWAKSIRQLGDTVVLEELWAFVCEVNAGESVSNPAAVMTKRLKAKGVK